MSRQRACFVICVWGKTYIDRLFEVAIPSYLAPGNLPALAQAMDLEIVILTTAEGKGWFGAGPQKDQFNRLQTVAPVRFIEIDDLVYPGLYGMTLTLSYFRAVRDYGAAMVGTTFFFMNADFILARDSLKNVIPHILAGRKIVVVPSFRCSESKEVNAWLARQINDGILDCPPREMVRVAFDNPHLTTIAKTVNQNVSTFKNQNQFYWKVDGNTLIGYQYLIFMLALTPERVVESISSYCDYSFIPEFCPSGDRICMQDSDDFFMLEVQDPEHEASDLLQDPLSPPTLAFDLSLWTTAEHRVSGTHLLVFHAEDRPATFDRERAAFDRFMEQIRERMTPEPVGHAFHPYWVGGVLCWRQHVSIQNILLFGKGRHDPRPVEMTPLPEALRAPVFANLRIQGERVVEPKATQTALWSRKIVCRLKWLLLGEEPTSRPWIAEWGVFRRGVERLRAWRSHHPGPLLAVCGMGGRGWVSALGGGDCLGIEDALNGEKDLRGYRSIMMVLRADEIGRLHSLLARCSQSAAPGTAIMVVAWLSAPRLFSSGTLPSAARVAAYLAACLPSNAKTENFGKNVPSKYRIESYTRISFSVRYGVGLTLMVLNSIYILALNAYRKFFKDGALTKRTGDFWLISFDLEGDQ